FGAVFVFALLIVGLIFGSIVPQIVTETRDLADRIPHYTARMQERVENWVNNPPPWLKKLIERTHPPAPTPITRTNESIGTVSTNVTSAEVSTTLPSGATNNPSLLGGRLDNQTLRAASG